MMDMMSFSKMEESSIAEPNWTSENVLHKTTKVLHKTPDFVCITHKNSNKRKNPQCLKTLGIP